MVTSAMWPAQAACEPVKQSKWEAGRTRAAGAGTRLEPWQRAAWLRARDRT